MEEEINLKDLFTVFKSKIPLSFIIVLFCCFLTAIYTMFVQVPMYQANTTLVLTMSNSSDTTTTTQSITQSDVTLNSKLVSTYSEIIKSRNIASEVISSLGLSMTEDELIDMVTVTAKEDTEMLNINVKNESADIAASIANEIADVFSEKIVDIYNIQNVSIIDVAKPDYDPYNMNVIKQLIIAFVVGLFIACLVVFLIYYFDTTVKSAEEIESKIGLPVLAVVPIDSDIK